VGAGAGAGAEGAGAAEGAEGAEGASDASLISESDSVEMIFGHLRTSTNYDENKKEKIVGGKNGFGFKLVLIWSTWGSIETVAMYKEYSDKYDAFIGEMPARTSATAQVRFFPLRFANLDRLFRVHDKQHHVLQGRYEAGSKHDANVR
jgi:DNA gyrase/topoisomerase IV subunit B